jgi:hypothetical protein
MVAPLLIALAPTAFAADGSRTDADRKATQGAVELGIGTAAIAGGLTLMLVGRGQAGDISDEEPFVHEARTIGGGVLIIAGITTVLVGANHLSKAKDMREREKVTTLVVPVVGPHGAGLVLDTRF